jgi:hypothetical protein
MIRFKAYCLFALALLLPSCVENRPSVTPLPPSGPTVIGAPPLASMAEYRREFTLRGADPDWTASMRPGELRLRVAGEPDEVVPLTLPTPCFVVGCAGAYFDTNEGRRAIVMTEAPCRIASEGPVYPFEVTLLKPGGRDGAAKLVGCARPGAAPIPGRSIRTTAPKPPPAAPPAPTAAQAREAFEEEARRATARPSTVAARPWHLPKWVYEGKGAVGRLHDLCTGAVEPKPTLSYGAWTWETIDPRKLNERDRQALLQWRSQQLASRFGCGTIFEIGDLGHRARKAAGQCPASAVTSQRPEASQAFVDYVNRNPEVRDSDDLLEVATAALRAAGCH